MIEKIHQYVSVTEFAEKIGFSRTRIYQLKKRGEIVFKNKKIPIFYDGTNYYFYRKSKKCLYLNPCYYIEKI
jgi:hypothetical protein